MEGLVEFLVKEKGFKYVSILYSASATYRMLSEERVRKGAEKLQKFLNSKQQGRLDGFFTVKAKEPAAPKAKGKAEDKKGKAGAKGVKRKVCNLFWPLKMFNFSGRGMKRREAPERRQKRSRRNNRRRLETIYKCRRPRQKKTQIYGLITGG